MAVSRGRGTCPGHNRNRRGCGLGTRYGRRCGSERPTAQHPLIVNLGRHRSLPSPLTHRSECRLPGETPRSADGAACTSPGRRPAPQKPTFGTAGEGGWRTKCRYCRAMPSLFRLALASMVVFGSSQVPCRAQHMNASEAPCRDAVATADMAQCFDRAYKNADHELNRVYTEVRAVLASQDQRNLEDAERVWLKYRDATCAAERSLYEGGTAASPAYLACLEEETRRRASDLRAIYGWKVEKAR